MKHFSLKQILFMAICSDIGIVCKKIISPFANVITDNLHVPGGIGTAFSISFIVIAAIIVNRFGAGMIMSVIQCATAFAIGSIGSMGALSIVAYFFPGLMIDLIIAFSNRFKLGRRFKAYGACIAAALTASVISNILIIHLPISVFALYCCVSSFSGVCWGFLASIVVDRIIEVKPKGKFEKKNKKNHPRVKRGVFHMRA